MQPSVDVWHVRTDAVDATTSAACMALLTAEERTKQARFVFERHRHEYLVTRGLAYAVLSTALGVAPSEMAFVRTEHGRPLLRRPRAPGTGELHFSLTNTVELVACGVAQRTEIGIDAEPLARADTILDIATTVFTAHELSGLGGLASPAQRRRAVELWTLKEAYMKARGLGFALPVKEFEIVFDAAASDGAVGLRFQPTIADAPLRWALSTFEVDDHLVATCVERTNGAAPEIRVRRADIAALLRSK